MAYEVEPIAPLTTPVDGSLRDSGKMREERVLEPYRKPASKAAAAPNPVQQDNTVPPKDPVAAEPAQTAESVALSPGMAALVRKEQRVRQQEAQLKAQQKALEAERAEIAELKALKTQLEAKDFSGIEKLVPYEDYTNHLIGKQTPESPEAKQIAELKAQIDKIAGTQQQSLEERMKEAVRNTTEAVKSVVESSADYAKVKDIKFHDGEKELSFSDAVTQHILDSWDEDEIELSPEQAAKEVKAILIDRAKSLSAIAEPAAPVIPPTQDPKTAQPKPAGTTLTNSMAAAGEGTRPNRPFHGMSDSERWAEARRRAEAKLKAQKTA